MSALVQHFHLDELAEHPPELHAALASIFGNGTQVLEKIIVNDLYRKLNQHLEQYQARAFEFSKLIFDAREKLRLSPRLSSC